MIAELNEIKEALTPSLNGSIIFERAISVRTSETQIRRYFNKGYSITKNIYTIHVAGYLIGVPNEVIKENQSLNPRKFQQLTMEQFSFKKKNQLLEV